MHRLSHRIARTIYILNCKIDAIVQQKDGIRQKIVSVCFALSEIAVRRTMTAYLLPSSKFNAFGARNSAAHYVVTSLGSNSYPAVDTH